MLPLIAGQFLVAYCLRRSNGAAALHDSEWKDGTPYYPVQ